MLHDDGCVIKGYHEYVPDGYIMQHANNCESCDWYNMGVVKYNGQNINVVESVRVYYDKYAGGFSFCGYCDDITDDKGNIDENADIDAKIILREWIEDKYTNAKIIFVE
jgi:hypothetical protein